ncbi:XPG I-region protein [Flagelloscypha sp. PMI_526]|nr:XPG I-region protein [Flagelloscypha sp. PMI_526]
MPIKHLDAYLQARNLPQTLPLSALADSRLGIDAAYYISMLLTSPTTREPLLAATGGLPLALSSHIESDLRALDKARIKPVFVFPGLPCSSGNKRKGTPPNISQEWNEQIRDRREAWSRYENGKEDEASGLWEGRDGLTGISGRQWELWRGILRVFRHRNVEFMIAPYAAGPQLIYLARHQKSYIHSIYGPTDLLLYPSQIHQPNSPTTNLITSLNLHSNSPTFTFVSKRALIQSLSSLSPPPNPEVTEDQFLDIGILLGFTTSGGLDVPSFAPVIHEQALKATTDMVKYFKSGHAAVQAYSEHPAVKSVSYGETFARTRSMIKYSLILSSEGAVTPLPLTGTPHPHLTASDIPQDLHEIFTGRLPDEIYFYLSRGLIGPQGLGWLVQSLVIEPPPLDNGETTEFRRFVKEVITEGQTGPRATALALLTSVLHVSWGKRMVNSSFWFSDTPGSIKYQAGPTTQLVERVTGWIVPYSIIEEELRRQNSATIDFALCLGSTASDRLAFRTKTAPTKEKQAGAVLEKKDEVVANVIWRFLELRGFLLNTHAHSPLARAMHTAVKGAKVNDKFQDSLYLFLELVRAGVMHGNLWSNRAFSGGPSFGTDAEKSSMLLVMRVLSIVPLAFKPQPWTTAPLSRELLVFNSFVRSLTRALRTLIEITAVNMFIRGDARRGREDFLELSISMPFQSEVNTGFGVLAKVYLDALTHFNGGVRPTSGDSPEVKEAKSNALEVCEDAFGGSVRNVQQEVERGFRFWDLALLAMRQLHSEAQVLKELIDQFEAAEAWLAPMRP